MSATRPNRITTVVALVLAVAGAAIAATALWVFISSPLNDPTRAPSVVVQSASGDATFDALVAAGICALVVASIAASWTRRTRLVVRSLAGVLMTASGVAAGLSLDPSREGLQSSFMVYPHGEGMAATARAFTTWIQQLSAFSWAYAACGAGILVTVLVVLSHGRRERGCLGMLETTLRRGVRNLDGAGS